MASMCRLKLAKRELVDIKTESMQLIDKIGWGNCFTSFNRNNIEVTRQFDFFLNKNVSQVGNLRLVISKDLIAKATNLPQTSESWFKDKEINISKWKHFFLPLP